MANNVCAIVGFGPGLGTAYGEVFQANGYDLALMSRSGAGLETAGSTEVKAYSCDAGDPESLRNALSSVSDDLGEIDVVIYNADLAQFGTLDDLCQIKRFQNCLMDFLSFWGC